MKSKTKQEQIQDWIRADLTLNNYQPGERLPYGVKELCERFDVSTATAVKAVRVLGDLGEVDVRPSIGYFAVGDEESLDHMEEARAAVTSAQRQLAIALRALDAAAQ